MQLGVWWSVQEDTSQHNCCNLPSQFYKLESLDSESVQNAQLRYHLWVWATPNVPASGLLLVTQLPLNSQPDDNRSCYIYRVQFANINGHYTLCTIVTLVVIVVINQLVKCVMCAYAVSFWLQLSSKVFCSITCEYLTNAWNAKTTSNGVAQLLHMWQKTFIQY